MIILGLTGSIGMGKSTAAKMFEAEGIPIYSADAAVHKLYSGKAAPLIEQSFPGTVDTGTVNRAKLAAAVLGDNAAMKKLEAIVHPLVTEEEQLFLEQNRQHGEKLVLLDIPLLFESGKENRVDKIIVVSAPSHIQRERVLAREGMSEAKLDAILARQLDDKDKRQRADYIIDTNVSFEAMREQIQNIIDDVREVSA